MIKSMTGFGRVQETVDGMNVTVELRSVNHRYFEFTAKVPRTYGFLEEKLKTFTNSLVSRGKVECYVAVEQLEESETTVSVNASLAKGYVDALRQLSEMFDLSADVSAAALSRYPDVLVLQKTAADEERIWNAVRSVAEKAVRRFIEMRETEGAKLKADILSRADTILEHVAFVETRSPQTVKEYNEKLKQRMEELLGNTQIDEQRLLTEAAIFADKIAVDEETVRAQSYFAVAHIYGSGRTHRQKTRFFGAGN